MYVCLCVTTIKEKGDHEFERDHREEYEKVLREEVEDRNEIVIISKIKEIVNKTIYQR